MKRGLFVLLALVALGGLTGCMRQNVARNGDDPCVQECGRHCRRPFGHGQGGPGVQPEQPPVAAVTYPYYTLRGPRDFLQREPSPIGP